MTQDMHVYGFKKRATSKMNRSTHTLSILMKQLRSSLEAGKKQLRSSLEAGKRQSGVRFVNEVTACRQRGYVLLSTRLRLVMTLLLLMTVGVTGVLAQIDFSGTYYIANETNHANVNFGTHWYLVPGADPHQPHYADAYFHNEYCNKGGKGDYTGTNYGDPEKPFLTTYQTNQDLNSIWIISSTGDGYYNIKHAKTGYYVVYEPPYKDAIHRKSMHLESTDSPGENAKFTITGSSLNGPININPKSVTSGNMYFNPAVGEGNRARYYGTGDYYHEGMIGLYSGSGDKSQWYLEKTAIPPTITYDEETGKATITSVTGTTIRYAFDGITPTISSTSYIEPVSMAGHTSIKAIAVDAENTISKVVTLTLKEYTYHILNKVGTTAIEHTIKQPVGKSFTNTYTDIPAAIRSPYLEDEEVKFFNNSAHADADEIYETPSTGTDIYVTYTTDSLMDKYLHLRGARALNITINGDYVYDSGTAGSGVLSHTSDDTDIATAPYQWLFSGGDPYAVEIKNAGTNNYLGYDTPLSSPTQLLLENTSTKKFIIMNTSGSGDYQQMELMAATGDGNYYRVGRTGDDLYVSTTATGDDAQVRVYPNSATIKYELIDQAGKIIMEISSKSESVELPSDWQSPLVSRYNYWKEGAFDTYGTGDNKVYKLKADPELYRITTLIGLEGDKIYVTYEVNDRVVFDISDDDKTHPESYQTYMLRFYQGESFNQEDGKDGIEVSAQKAEYPYSNGDAMLYVYSDTKRENQFASGASTRPRWLWYAVSPKAAKVDDTEVTPGYKGDPYHVKIMSNSSQASSHNYFRTYVVNYGGSNHVVTGVTTKNEDVSDPEDANYQPPTEYMVLSAPNGRYKLVTLNEIDGAPENGTYGTRQTVNTFEQYWKNNPTVQNRLGDAKVTTSESTDGEGIELTTAQASILTGWHTYKAWANAAPWVEWSEDGKTGKKYKNKHHWFQTIDMGSTGEFAFVAQSIDPEVILLDQHGWEIMRAPLSDASALRKYDSPMVEEYQWYPTAAKVAGYHKYKVSNPNIPIYYSYIDDSGKTKWALQGDSVTFTSTTLGANPYTYIVERGYEDQDKSVKTDFYVTYTVRPEYAALYSGAATEDGVTPSIYMVKQGDEYAKINNSNQLDPTTDNPYSLESIGDEWHWYVKPNFNIDTEMGYKYDVDEDDGAGGTFTPNKAQKEVLNYEEGRNGFDPYNVQIQSVKSPTYYFKTSTTGSQLTKGVWEGNSTDLALDNLRRPGTTQEGIDGNDQTKLSITNATFMVVKDASDHMLLMPRFDHKKVVNSFTAPRLSAANAATQTLELLMAPKIIHNSNEFLSMNGQYTLADDFTFADDFESLGSEMNPFTGSIDGALHTLTGISTPLIAYADGAIIKNVIFNNVTIGNKEDVPNVGAIAANATGETRIYNCGILSGSVSGTGNAGSIVGNLDGSSRVINCYSYANVTGTTNTGGIVGYNAVENVSSTNLKTMVMNCMFYGDVTGGKVSPIYGGEIIDNLRINNSQKQGLNNFNYYAFEKATSFNALKDNNANKVYNNALAMEERFLTRFEIYRQLLNGNRRLAAYYATSSEATVKASDMMKWVLETADRSIDSPKEYPILKAQAKYPSIINYDIEHASDSASVGRNHGGKLGRTLRVNLSGTGITTSKLDLERTDKDFDHFNYNYDKVQLPYFNDVGTGNYTNNQVVTGWKIIGITTIADDPYTSANYPSTGITDYPNHNYADRKSSNKDLYSVSGRVFSQGAYFDVPYGVSEITIEPYWATAAYVADEYLDVVYDAGWTGNSVTQLGKQFPTGKITINGSEQTVYKSISAALSGKTSSSVYDLAIVLVGNLHTNDVPSNGTVPFTIMSVDLDKDNEPDYSYIYSHGKRAKVSPIRFDFINVPGTAQAQKPRGATQLRNAAIFNTIGWFELTNTTLMYFSQIEYENSDQTQKAPMILQGGVVDQFVSTVSHTVDGDNIYIHVGGNVWFKSFTMGTHGDGSKSTPHVPVSVTGGDYDSFYLTGMYNSNADVRDDNAECYISGGRFGEVAGAGQEQIGTTGTKTNGNIRWQIYNADISEFYGGGINEAKPVQGNIQTDIFNSYVDKFCGGPKFGNMAKDKTVVTNAIGCTFEKYFGAGNGGNSYSRKKYYDKEGVPDENTWNTLNGYYTTDRGKFFDGKNTGSSQTSGKDYGKKGYGVATDFDYEFFVWTSGTAGVRIYLNFASFSLAQCNNVTSTLTNCTINQDFYGGGNLGSVKGTATSTLNGCTVHGNVFGGGYSAELPKIPVRDAGFTKYPNFNTNSGMFEPGTFSGTTDYDWKHVDNDPANGTAGTEDNKYVVTKTDLDALGQVAHTDLTVTNNCLIEGGVYGGGDMSAVNQNTLVKIANVKTSGDIQNTVSYVYGGGNTADVLGNTEVRMTNGTVSHDIYGGGRGETTVVGGNVTVNVGTTTGDQPTVSHDVYGGSAFGSVNTTADKTTIVNIYDGTVNGSVFGGGLGQEHVAARDAVGSPGDLGYVPAQAEVPAIVAQNQGNTTVNVEGGTVKTGVYGGSNKNGVLTKDATVTITGGTVGDSEHSDNNVVFGGGYGAPTLVNGNVEVNVGTSGQETAGATIYGHVYGGGALGNTNASGPSTFNTDKKTKVNLYKGTINGYAYGGGLGSAEIPSYVGGDSVIVILDGAKVKQVFGANNINGTPKGHVKVWVKRTIGDSAKDENKGREDRGKSPYVYDVEAVYGGGNEADYVPTKATGTAAEQEEAFAEVLIEGCDKTSINAVYGGGNAAAVPATNVTVKGTYIINTLYGGGNGADPAKPGADVGIYKVGETPTNYGTGKAETKLLGGYINEVYGGSNTKGDVRGGTDVQTKGKTEVVTGDYCTKLDVGQIYGAGSHADVNGNVNIILECMPEDYVDAVYGGAEEATVDGNVTLTVTSGKFGRVFGGNNAGGNVKGTITVYVKEEGCQDLEIGELYGGGNLAPYSKYGCYYDAVNSKWKQYTTKSEENGNFEVEFDEHEQYPYHVKVFVESCTSIGSIFGGGRGATAEIMGDTYVNINMLKGIVNNTPQKNLGKIGRVFGGGSAADVKGNTLVEIGTETASEPSGVIIADGTDFYINPDPEEYKTTPRVTISGSEAGIYGGGLSADVDGNTTLNIGTENLPLGTSITGNIYGGGLGETTHVTGNVTVNIGADTGEDYVGYAVITGDVYGGSAKGKVNSHLVSSVETPTADAATKVNFYGGFLTGNIYGGGEGQRSAAAQSAVYYTQSECDAYNTEHSLSPGDDGYLTTSVVKIPAHDALPAIAADVYGPVTVTMEKGGTTNTIVNNVFGCNNFNGAPQDTVAVIINGGTINESVYGGGDEAEYTAPEGHKDYPAVYVNNAAITKDVFGGGLGLTAVVTGNPHVTVGDKAEGHDVTILKSVYGGGQLAGVDGNTNIEVNNGTIGTEGKGAAEFGNVYGGGFGTDDTSEMTEAEAVKEAGIVKGNTTITINGGTILHNIYGGGANGSVGTFTYDANNVITGYTSGGLATINILGGTIGTNGHENGMIFGSSRGDVGAPNSIQDKVAWVYDTQVTIGTSGHGTDAPEPQIRGSVYGGGENGHTYRNASLTLYSGKVGVTEDLDSDPAGQKGAAYPYRGNFYGGGCGTDTYWVDANGNGNKEAEEYHYNKKAGIVNGTATVVINGGHIVRNLYGAGAMGSAVVGTNVTINGGTIGTDGAGGGYVYAAARGDEALTDADQAYVGSTSLTIAGGTIWNSAFGGGQSGIVKGSVAVTVSGGVVKNDVYGGGALANTNTDNWNTSTNNWSDASTATYYAEVKHLKKDESSVEGYYTRGGESEPYTYTPASGTADGTSKYYKKLDGFSTVAVNGTAKKTTVSLTGGTVGNAYGGGLGRLAKAAVVAVYTAVTDGTTLTKDKKYYTSDTGAGEFTSDGTEIADGTNYFELTTPASAAVPAIEAMVYGDISVTVDGTKFTKETERVDGKAIPVTGRVFGCNNLNGTPKGSVKVWVKQTKRLDDGSHVKNQFEIQGVYGGGNMSNYVPKTYDTDTEYGQHTQVIIDGCDKTSIERVYGGGNASDVPFTDVTIDGAFQIGYVFGGGNGGDKINKGAGAGWESNPGANVSNYTNVVLHGGTIGEAFGGSDSKGIVGGSELTTAESGECPLITNNIYGASKEAETDNDVILNLVKCTNSVVDKVFGGSYNANVRGSITVNIFSGIYTSVFGGNDRKGTVGGNITINVEEVDECNPVIIQNLVGGGSQADYPGVDDNGEGDPVPAQAYKGAPYVRGKSDAYEDFTSGNITINVKAATRIDKIFGGCDNATATGTTTVNINMVKGRKAGVSYTLPEGYTGDAIPNIVDGVIKNKIGTIGSVYGGGNDGDVIGNSIVNIGTEEDIAFTNTSGDHYPVHLTPNASGKYDVLGAHIDGDVYGGGNNGSVTGNTYVNICAKYDETEGEYVAVPEGAEDVTIGGNVFGGGKGAADSFTCEKAMVGVDKENAGGDYGDKGTHVYIGHGSIGGSVYGGGEIGRVEFDTKVTIGFGDGSSEAAKSPVIGGEVYGAGQGVPTHGYSGLTRGNSYATIQGDSWVKKSVYGAGKVASLGRFNIAKTDEEAAAHGVEKGMPYELLSGGRSTVTIQGYAKVGPEAEMTMPTFLGNVFGAGQGALPYDVVGEPGRYYIDNSGNYTWESYANDSRETAYLKYIETLGITNNTVVTIGGNAFVHGSVYGGSMNGSVFAGTVVNISGGQIGRGSGKTGPYTEVQWTGENSSDFTECPSWTYGQAALAADKFAPYDKYAGTAGYDSKGGRTVGDDGHTFYGNVFGGGSGKDPYKPGKWHRRAGYVGGNTEVNITGGHILTSVYGGNEMTDVGSGEDLTVVPGKGKCTVNMTGGTLGVPREDGDATDHPVTCYLFGAGKGDQRIFFNTWTNVSDTEVNVTGSARIFGSVFGGGEDGHILRNAAVNIGGTVKIDLNGDGDTDDDGETFTATEDLKIGTTGTSYVDGNVFGGGRGFSGKALTAGSTGGNVTMTIAGGTMLGSVYGGGRLASVGIPFTSPEDNSYGQLLDDKDGKTYGHISINISGGTIGTTTASDDTHPVGGNVFGGSMGRITLLDNSLNPLWPREAVVKLTDVTISGGTIMNNVYGGSEYGIVRNFATVNIRPNDDPLKNPVIHGNVFGGGYGSDNQTKTTITPAGYSGVYYTFTPMLWTGCVSGSTFVNISGGTVDKNVYGGGDMASVGLIDFVSDEDGNFTGMTKHEVLTGEFGLSWPYKFRYHAAAPGDPEAIGGGKINGKSTVNITGTANITGIVFGAGKGKVWFGETKDTPQDITTQRYTEAFMSNVLESEVIIGTEGGSDNPHVRTVYGGGEDGHVYENAKVTIHRGTIDRTVFGGGKGTSPFKAKLLDPSTKSLKVTAEDVHSWTAGKVYGNTEVIMNGGSVGWFIYGGGNMASVGKGNYSGGADDYSEDGYGETLTGNLWDNVNDNSKAFLSSGNTTVTVMGGTVGAADAGLENGIPKGSIFGGSRGQTAADCEETPRYQYFPDFYLGHVNKATINIGGTSSALSANTPNIYGCIYGGGQDGHVRNSTEVKVFKGNINRQSGVAADRSGNVFGAGSGIGTYTTDGVNNYCNSSSGSVTCSTLVEVYDDADIKGSVYGGGALASVGPSLIGTENEQKEASSDHASYSCNTVNIKGGSIGGSVYGASRGPGSVMFSDGSFTGVITEEEDPDEHPEKYNPETYATSIWTEVNIEGGTIGNNVYGGGEMGQVKESTKVNLRGGTIAHNAYGGGKGTLGTYAIEANVGDSTTVKLNEGKDQDDSGCIVEKVFGCNDLNGSPKGHALVHVYATQHKGTDYIVDGSKHKKFDKLSNYKVAGDDNYTVHTFDGKTLAGLAADAGLTSGEISGYESAITGAANDSLKNVALQNYIYAIADNHYDVKAVYGGGDLAKYEPTDPTPGTPLNDTEEYAEVIIEGCELTSIGYVYGGGNAASTPSTKVRINEAYEIHEVFGGGNGKDNYQIEGNWYKNPGANVGYYATYHHDTSSGGTQGSPYPAIKNDGTGGYPDATTKEARIANYSYGEGSTNLEVTGGRIHRSYGGSNQLGNIRYQANSAYEESGACPMLIDETYGGGNKAETDADIRTEIDCVDNMDELYGGSTSGDVNSDIVLNVTNGTFGKVFGGNKEVGRILGSITVNVREEGCKPVIIGSLYAGGYKADYSIYGYSGSTHNTARTKTEWESLSDEQKAASPIRKDPRINIISATRIDNVYGGGYQARVVGEPHVNINMEEGTLLPKYMKDDYLTEQTDATGVKWICRKGATVGTSYIGILPVGTIGNVFGGGNQANVEGNTSVEIGTGKHHNNEGEEEVITPARNAAFIQGRVYGGGNLGDVTGNTTVEMGNGYVYDRIYGGGKEGNVGKIDPLTTSKHTGTAAHEGCIGKPTTFAANTGKCTVTISGGYVGPFAYSYPEAVATATITPMTMPDDYGYVFGAGRGELDNPATDKDIDFKTYVDSTVVTIKNGYVAGHEGDAEYITRPLIAGGVYGGAENGRVLRNTHVNIQGGQIGLGAARDTAYVEADFIDPTAATATQIDAKAATMAECASWAYGIDTNTDGKNDTWLPYDEHAGAGYDAENYGAASTTGSDGHTFYGNVFGGGSGYFTYAKGDGTFEWLPSAGLVEGNTYVNISGGHILTSVYGGNEMTNVTGTTNVTMTGGTLGVPRTLAQIAAHPVTCYLFGGGKGDERVHFNKSTNVGHAKVNVSGGIIYGSVFGGGEDGHVLGDVTMNISDGAKIGTWGTSYVDGNVFGGGRGFSGGAYTAGNVAGSVTLNITGGTMLGSIYGGGRLGSVGYGLFAKNEEGYGEMRGDDVTETGFAPPGGFSNGRGHIVVNISGDNTVIGNKYEFQNVPTNVATGALAAWQTTNHVEQTTYETTTKTVDLTTTYTHRLLHTRGGNVYTGGMGRRTQLDGTTPISTYDGDGVLTSPIEWKKLGNVKSTKLTISGNPWIMGNVYGGGEFGAVQGIHTTDDKEWGTEINIIGGTLGTEITSSDPKKGTVDVPDTYPATGNSNVQYTYGNVFGGGTGTYDDVTATTPVSDANKLAAYVANNTKVSVTNALVRGSVFGGGELGAVGGDTYVTISGTTEIGRNEVKAADDADAGYVLYGGRRMGNVFGGGRGHETAAIAGVVKGNTNVTISGGNIYHNVYGGGALGSVGNFFVAGASDGGTRPGGLPDGIPYWTIGAGGVANGPDPAGTLTPTPTTTGVTNVTITGGTIGISGRDNGLVFGSSRGDISAPDPIDKYDRTSWVRGTVVNIGTNGSGTTLNTPLVKGSVYGGGENGHNYQNANVNVYSGTIGVTDTADPWYYFTDKTLEKEVQLYRGNVYGAGSGSDTYKIDGKPYHNPRAGMVGGSTLVNIAGGHVGRSVYGAGAMASVGNVTNAADTAGVAKHSDENAGFALSWPYKYVFAPSTGMATVNVRGGHIGTRDLDGGDVYGSARGEAGDRYATAHMAFANETVVNINYPETAEMTSEEDIQNDFTVQCITGSVHGSGENGYVYGDTRVTLNEGLIGHSLYGAGKGKGRYPVTLNKIDGSSGTYNDSIYSLIAGRVMGNTYVTMNGGHVGRNVYGGGNMGSVGKGNYACGSDDYYPAGYGETLNGSATAEAKTLWDSGNENSIAFLNSGKTTVQVLGGIVGYENDPTKTKNNLPYGNVFGGSAGEAAPNVPVSASPRYLYCPAFFSGYVNETDVTIGTSGQVTDENAGKPGYAPKILCSVYGGGQDGHVRRDTKVTVYSGEIGMPYTTENQALLNTDDLDDPMWMHRGNIYGGGSGISEYKFHFNYTDDDYDDTVVIDGREYKETDYSTSAGSVTRFTDVNVMGGIIHRNVYGGGSMGSVGAPTLPPSRADLPDKKGDTTPGHGVGWQSQNTVNIGGGTTVVTIGTPTGYNKTYGGEVYGACRGMSILDPNQYANSVWTKVNIFDKSTIRGNVYGGGDSGIVKKDSEVKIGGNRP